MLAKMTAKNQVTLPKSVTSAVGPTEYSDVPCLLLGVDGKGVYLVTGDRSLLD